MATNYQVRRGTDVGSLKLSEEELCFTVKGENESTTIGWDQLEKHQSNPPKSAKVMIKLVSKDGATITLQLKNRTILDELQDDITKRIENFKPQTEDQPPEAEPDPGDDVHDSDPQTSVYEKVSLASASGSVTLSDDALVFQPDGDGESMEIPWSQVTKHQSSPPKIPKAMLKVVLSDGKNHNFQLTDRTELKRFHDDVTLRRENHKTKPPVTASTSPAPVTGETLDKEAQEPPVTLDKEPEQLTLEPADEADAPDGEDQTENTKGEDQVAPEQQPAAVDETNDAEGETVELTTEQQSVVDDKMEEEQTAEEEKNEENHVEAATASAQVEEGIEEKEPPQPTLIEDGIEENEPPLNGEGEENQDDTMAMDPETGENSVVSIENEEAPEQQMLAESMSEDPDSEGEGAGETTAQEKGQTSKEDSSMQESSQSPKEEPESTKESETQADDTNTAREAAFEKSEESSGDMDTTPEIGPEGNDNAQGDGEGRGIVIDTVDPAANVSPKLVDYSKQKAVFGRDNSLNIIEILDENGGIDMDDSINSMGGYMDGETGNSDVEPGVIECQDDSNEFEVGEKGGHAEDGGDPLDEDQDINSDEEETQEYGEGGFEDDGEPYPDEDLFEGDVDPETGEPYPDGEYSEGEIDPETGEPYVDEYAEGEIDPGTGEPYLDDKFANDEINPETGEPYGDEEYFEGGIDPETGEPYPDEEFLEGGIDPETGEPYLDDEEPPEGDINPETGEPYSSPFGEELYDEDEEEEEEEEHMSSLLVGDNAGDDESLEDEDFDVLSGKPIKVGEVEQEEEEEEYYDEVNDQPRLRRMSEFEPDDNEPGDADSDTEETPFFDDNDDSEYGAETGAAVQVLMGSSAGEGQLMEDDGSYSGSDEERSEGEEMYSDEEDASDSDESNDESDESDSSDSSEVTSSSSESSESSDSESSSDSDSETSEEDYEDEEEEEEDEEEEMTEYQDPASAWLTFAEKGDEGVFPEAQVSALKRKQKKQRKKKRRSEDEDYSDGEEYMEDEYDESDEIDDGSYSDEESGSEHEGEDTQHSMELELDVNDLSVEELESALATKPKAEMLQSLREDVMHGSSDQKGGRKHPGLPEDFYDWAQQVALNGSLPLASDKPVDPDKPVEANGAETPASSLPVLDPGLFFDWVKFSKEGSGVAIAKPESSGEQAIESDPPHTPGDAEKPTAETSTAIEESESLPLQPYDHEMVEKWTQRPKPEDPEARYFNWKGFTNARRPNGGATSTKNRSGAKSPFNWKKYAKKQRKAAEKKEENSGATGGAVVKTGLDLLKTVMSTKDETKRKAILNQHLAPAPSPDQADGHVTPHDLLEAIATFVDAIRNVKQSDNAPEITTARQVAIIARLAIIEQYGEDSEALQSFQMGLQPAFAPKFETQ